MNNHSATSLLELYRCKELSPVEVIDQMLGDLASIDPQLNAFTHVDEALARSEAKASEDRWLQGRPSGHLDGIPIPIKDLVDVSGMPTRHGSLSSDKNPISTDAPCVARLREAGAILFGKTTTPEFGWKGMTDSPLSGTTRNPHNITRTSGGSSGGAAACVASGITALAHGNDGGGSIRIPASYCGIYGIKPTFGRVPEYPRGGAYDSLASEGPLCRTVRDAALFLNEVCAADNRDWLSLPSDKMDYTANLNAGVKGLRIGVCISPGAVKASDEIVKAVTAAAAEFEALGAHIDGVDNLFDPLQPIFERYWRGGLYARLAMVPSEQRTQLDTDFIRVASLGEDVSLAEFSEGVVARAELSAKMAAFHDQYDLLLCPSMPTDPPLVETHYHTAEFDRWQHATPYTVPFNLTGQPAASIPCGVSSNNLPIGLQIVGSRFSDALVLRASAAYESIKPIRSVGN